MNDERNSNKIICDRSLSNSNEDAIDSSESIHKVFTRKLKGKRRMGRKETNYKQRVVSGDEFYRREKTAADILGEIIPPKTSSPIESSDRSGSSSNMQPYSRFTDSDKLQSYMINDRNEKNSFRQFVDREKEARLVALEQIASDATKLKCNVEKDRFKMHADRGMHLCRDFTPWPSYSAF